MTWLLNVIFPDNWIGTNAAENKLPTFNTRFVKNGRVIMKLPNAKVCPQATCRTSLDMSADSGSALISFGVDPADTENKGVGIYSMPYCLKAADLPASDDSDDKLSTNC